METISNVANAAVKAVWGEQETNKEPVSGVSGDVSKGEPYDAGNLDPASQQKKVENTSTGGTQTTASSLDPTSTGKPTYEESHLGQRSGDQTSTDPISAGTTLGGQSSTGQSSSGLQSTSSAQRDSPVQTDTYSGPRDTTAGQSDTRDSSKVDTDTKKQDVDINTPGPTSEGKSLTAKGPRPLEIVANEHGGDAGQIKKQENISSSNQSSTSENQPEKKSEYHDPKEKEYIKTTGFAADGGDFDASKPGAGREADRLYDEKQHRGGLSGAQDSSSQESSHHMFGHHSHSKGPGEGSHGHGHEKEGSEKPSLGERIKAKLHKH